MFANSTYMVACSYRTFRLSFIELAAVFHLSTCARNVDVFKLLSEKPTLGYDACCCKERGCSTYREDQIGFDFGGKQYCCKKRTFKERRCDKRGGYGLFLSDLTTMDSSNHTTPIKGSKHGKFEPLRKYSADTCAGVPVQDSRVEKTKLKRVNAFFCPQRLDCPPPPEEKSVPVDWSSKCLICRGVRTVIEYTKPLAPKYFNTTQGTGVLKEQSGVLSSYDVIPELSSELAASAGPVALAGGVAGALINILKLIHGVCMESLAFLTSCSSGVSMTAVVVAVVALSLAFTGVGVPISALGLGLNSVMLRRLGPLFCEHGLIGVFRHLGKAAVDILTQAKKSISRTTLPSLGKIAGLAKTAAKKFFKMFWTLLKTVPSSMVAGFKAFFKAPGPQPSRQLQVCCQLRAARDAFKDVPEAERETAEALGVEDSDEAKIDAKLRELEDSVNATTRS